MDIRKAKGSPTPTPANTPIVGAPISQGVTFSGLSSTMSKKGKVAQIEEVDDVEDAPQLVDPALLREMIDSQMGRLSLANLPESQRKRINALKSLQSSQTTLEAEFREEVLALERKYLGLYTPLWQRRADLVNGDAEPTDEESAYQSDDEEEEELEEGAEKPAAPEEAEGTKGVPAFWLNVLKMCPITTDLITERDEEAIEFLRDIRLAYTDDNHGFSLEFVFAPNPYFDDTSLLKTYYLENAVESGMDDLVYSRATGSTIHWKKDMDLTVTIETKKQRQKGTNKTRVVKRAVPTESFFNFFSPPQIDEDDEEADQGAVEEDFEIGEMFKTKIVPHAVDWFTGKALEYDDYGQYGDEDEDGDYEDDEDHFHDDEDEDEEDEEDDEDDDDDEDKSGKGHRHHGHSHSHGHGHAHGKQQGKAGDKPEECKQQ